jgi:hypothetical protein
MTPAEPGCHFINLSLAFARCMNDAPISAVSLVQAYTWAVNVP